ncbi:MAG: hypothetical protein R3277_06335 [Brumimicrobium sp.]|nr:hypothetical protein [Brumimicrobium sp.]
MFLNIIKLLLSLFLFTGSLFSFSQDVNGGTYDSILAKKLGGDEYGMKNYTFVILTTGDSVITDKSRRNELFSGHLKNIGRLVNEGKLIVAGPLGSNELAYRGIFIFDKEKTGEIEQVLMTDPAIQSGLLNYLIFDWYGSAALPTYMETHKKIQKTDF